MLCSMGFKGFDKSDVTRMTLGEARREANVLLAV